LQYKVFFDLHSYVQVNIFSIKLQQLLKVQKTDKMTSKSELAAMHLRAEHLKASLGSRVKQRNFLSDPKAWTEHQVKRHSVNLNCLKISLLFNKARSIGKLSLIVKEVEKS
jgi:hypothetical protein